MVQVHRVYFLGNLTRNPEVRYAPNGVAVARYGVAVPTRIRQEGHVACRRLLYRGGRLRAPRRYDGRLAAQRPRRPDRGALAVAAVAAGGAVSPHP